MSSGNGRTNHSWYFLKMSGNFPFFPLLSPYFARDKGIKNLGTQFSWSLLLKAHSFCCVPFFSVAVVEPGGISSTPFGDSAREKKIGGLESDNEMTRDVVKKTYDTIVAMTAMEDVMQTPDEVAEHIIKVVKAEKPHLHNITNKMMEGELKKKFVDITGDIAVERITRQFFG